jgi:tRNA A37 threonylcarbamoyladenosine dehydratase
MEQRFLRTASIIGEAAQERLKRSHVIVFGVGGVGGYAVEALARAGIGTLTLVDNDVISLSNINRQIIATHSTVGKAKVEAFAERIKDINPDCKVITRQEFFLPELADGYNFSDYDYIVDAIDTVSAKLALAQIAEKENVKIISSMGAGNKLNPLAFEITDIYKTSVCPLARAMRAQLKRRGVKSLKVVYSKEEALPRHPSVAHLFPEGEKAPGSISFVPSAVGLIIAGEVIRELAEV